ncbi:MAG: ferrochelatase [Actinomycetota bacterium]
MSDAVVLMAYGSPERIVDVPAYYADIRGGRPIAPEHLADLVERYRRLGVEESNPLNLITESTRAGLERELQLPVYTGMKHWTPRIADAAERARDADRIVGLVLAPHYSALSIKGYREQLEQALGSNAAKLRFVESWHDEPNFVDLLADKVRGADAHVVFTAHSLPERIVAMGDPYKDQLLETARLVAERAAIGRLWSFSFQSESPTGEPWLGPDILDHLRDLHRQGVTKVLVCPVGFISDHLEIRWDIDVEAQDLATELGLELSRIEMPNDSPAMIRTLAGIVRRTLGS